MYASARRPETIAELQDAGARTLALDVTDEDSMRAAVATVEQAAGAVGVLINNAGYSQSGAIETVPMDAVRRQFETNVFGAVRLTQLVLAGMRAQRWGKIVNVGSMGGRLTFPGGGQYHATKYALEAISDALRFEVRGFGIDVILLEPGLITTEFGEAATASMAGIDAAGDDPYATFNATVGAVTKGAYDGPMRHLGAGPERVAKVDRAGDRAHAPAGADHDHAVGEDDDRDPPAAERPRLGRGDAPAVPAAAVAEPATRSAGRGGRRCGRSAHLEALRVVDPELPQHARSWARRRRTRRSSARPCRARRRRAPHDQLIGARGGQAADEVAVDLQVAEGQVLEVLEGAEAGAEVVERHRAAEREHARAEGAGAVHVGDRGGLGDLDHQARRLDAVPRERRSSMCEHPASVTDRAETFTAIGPPPRRASPASGARPAARRPSEHHPVDLADQAVALGRGQEPAGRDQAPAGSSASRSSASWWAMSQQ